jgi:putative membrane protein
MTDQIENKSNQTNTVTELAKERTHGAFDRTMMAWVRTALALIGFGVGIFEFASRTGGESIFRSSKLVAVLLIVLGVLSMFLAIKENKESHASLLNAQFSYVHKTSLAIKVGYALIVIGIIALVHIVLKVIE